MPLLGNFPDGGFLVCPPVYLCPKNSHHGGEGIFLRGYRQVPPKGERGYLMSGELVDWLHFAVCFV